MVKMIPVMTVEGVMLVGMPAEMETKTLMTVMAEMIMMTMTNNYDGDDANE